MIGGQEQFSKEKPLDFGLSFVVFKQTRQHLKFQSKLFKTLKSRSQALGDRLQNEIHLVTPCSILDVARY